MQLVERGLIHIDDAIAEILPELASQPILKQRTDGTLERFLAKISITLRDLLTHSSGATYDWIDPQLTAWRISRGGTPRIVEDGNIAQGYAYPRA
jgi:CubicO group peptidase (beta-lactamase class C family)